MRIDRRVLLAVLGFRIAAFAEDGVLMNGNALTNGLPLNFTTRLEPAKPSIRGGFIGGTWTNLDGIHHRYLGSIAQHQFFGYDLSVVPGSEKGTYRATVNPLSMTPAQLEIVQPESWKTIALPGYPGPQTVREGDTMAIEMFFNPATGQKITDYVYFPRANGRPAATHVIAQADGLYVNVVQQPFASGIVNVRPDGFVTIKSVGDVKAEGRTTQQVADAIAEAMEKKLGHPVKVNVQVVRGVTRGGPRKAPEFVVNLQDGKPLALSSLRGKTVALVFMMTTCPHCQGLCAILAGIQKDYAAKGVVFVGDAVDEGAKDGLAAYVQSYSKGAFPVGWSTRESAQAFLQIPQGPLYVPTMVFLDRQGMIQSQFLGSEDFFRDQDKNIRAELDRILAGSTGK